MQVKNIDLIKAKAELKKCPKIVRGYVAGLERIYCINRISLQKAISKLKSATEK